MSKVVFNAPWSLFLKSQYLYEEDKVYCVIHSVPENDRLTFTFDKDNNVTEMKKKTVPVAFYQYDPQRRLIAGEGKMAMINPLKDKRYDGKINNLTVCSLRIISKHCSVKTCCIYLYRSRIRMCSRRAEN